MKYIYLINNKNIFEKVMVDNENEILEEIYYLKYKIPTIKDISNSSKEIKDFLAKDYKKYSKKLLFLCKTINQLNIDYPSLTHWGIRCLKSGRANFISM